LKSFVVLRIVLAGLAFVAAGARAHHSLAEIYDRARQITLEGTVTQVSWVNPHVRFVLDTANDAGEAEHWLVEMDPPRSLLERGWRLDTLGAGSVVRVRGYKAIDGSPITEAITVQLASGRTLVASTDASWNWLTAPAGTLTFPLQR
jgi:Family of unknown function (DUF6152)